MAEVVRYVNTASSGGDGTTNGESGATAAYASLALWEAGEQTDLPAAGNTHVVKCSSGSGSVADSTNVSVSGWVTGVANRITIEGNTGHRATNKWDTSIYRLEPSISQTALLLAVSYVTIRHLQIGCTSTTYPRFIYAASKYGMLVDSCFCHMKHALASGADVQGILLTNTNLAVINCIVVVIDTGNNTVDAVLGISVDGISGVNRVYNNTVYVGVKSDYAFSAGIKIKRLGCIGKNNLVDLSQCSGLFTGIQPLFDATEDYNAVTDASTSGANSRNNQTFSFVDADNADFTLASDDSGAKGFGADLSEDADFPFADDINEDARPDTWDIGAVNALQGGGFIPKIIII